MLSHGHDSAQRQRFHLCNVSFVWHRCVLKCLCGGGQVYQKERQRGKERAEFRGKDKSIARTSQLQGEVRDKEKLEARRSHKAVRVNDLLLVSSASSSDSRCCRHAGLAVLIGTPAEDVVAFVDSAGV